MQCPNSTYSEAGTATVCINCTFGCLVCNSTGCVNCSSGFVITPALGCIECNIQACASCSSDNICVSCQGNYSLAAFQSGQTYCFCEPPFGIDDDNQCICPKGLIFNGSACLCKTPYCTTCNPNNVCEYCAVGYVLYAGNC